MALVSRLSIKVASPARIRRNPQALQGKPSQGVLGRRVARVELEGALVVLGRRDKELIPVKQKAPEEIGKGALFPGEAGSME
jgi:hypothetical protein